MKEDRQFVTALARGLRILSCFSAHRPQLGASEIARITGLPQPTVWRLCHTLISLGYLVPNRETEKLRVGAPVLTLGYAAIASLAYADVIRPHVEHLAKTFSVVCSVSERHDRHMIYVDRIQRGEVMLASLNVGSRIAIKGSAAGWAWLAGQTEDVREETLKDLAKQSRKGWKEDLERIHAAMEFYAKHGFVLASGILHPEWIAVAAPVRSTDGQTNLTISAGAHRSPAMERRMQTEIGPELKRIASLINGGSSPHGAPAPARRTRASATS